MNSQKALGLLGAEATRDAKRLDAAKQARESITHQNELVEIQKQLIEQDNAPALQGIAGETIPPAPTDEGVRPHSDENRLPGNNTLNGDLFGFSILPYVGRNPVLAVTGLSLFFGIISSSPFLTGLSVASIAFIILSPWLEPRVASVSAEDPGIAFIQNLLIKRSDNTPTDNPPSGSGKPSEKNRSLRTALIVERSMKYFSSSNRFSRWWNWGRSHDYVKQAVNLYKTDPELFNTELNHWFEGPNGRNSRDVHANLAHNFNSTMYIFIHPTRTTAAQADDDFRNVKDAVESIIEQSNPAEDITAVLGDINFEVYKLDTPDAMHIQDIRDLIERILSAYGFENYGRDSYDRRQLSNSTWSRPSNKVPKVVRDLVRQRVPLTIEEKDSARKKLRLVENEVLSANSLKKVLGSGEFISDEPEVTANNILKMFGYNPENSARSPWKLPPPEIVANLPELLLALHQAREIAKLAEANSRDAEAFLRFLDSQLASRLQMSEVNLKKIYRDKNGKLLHKAGVHDHQNFAELRTAYRQLADDMRTDVIGSFLGALTLLPRWRVFQRETLEAWIVELISAELSDPLDGTLARADAAAQRSESLMEDIVERIRHSNLNDPERWVRYVQRNLGAITATQLPDRLAREKSIAKNQIEITKEHLLAYRKALGEVDSTTLEETIPVRADEGSQDMTHLQNLPLRAA